METHNETIYHCIACGRVEHAELEAAPPQCCGHAMTEASEETVHPGDVPGETPGSVAEAATLAGQDQPR